jgi:hypothetical protein
MNVTVPKQLRKRCFQHTMGACIFELLILRKMGVELAEIHFHVWLQNKRQNLFIHYQLQSK